MKAIILLSTLMLAMSCASQQPLQVPADQAVGLSYEQGQALAQAMRSKGGLLYGPHYFYGLTSPTGWVLDNSAGVEQGLDAVFYQEGESWASATTIMYPQVWQKEGKQLSEIVAEDIERYRASFPSLQVSDAPAIEREKGQEAAVKHFAGGARNQFEAIAYLDEPQVVIMVVYQAPTREAFEKAYPSFAELVRSLVYLGESAPAGLGR